MLDVAVVGGGPAGLLLASRISTDARVAVFEAGVLGTSTKFWLTSGARLAQHGLEAANCHSATRALLLCFMGSRAEALGDFAVVDEHVLLGELIERCREKGAVLREKESVVGLRWGDNCVHVATERDEVRARLVVDASGGASPIAQSFRLQRILGFHSVYGGHLKNIEMNTADIIGADATKLGEPLAYFEVFPTSESSAFCCVFVVDKRLHDPARLRALFEDRVASTPHLKTTSRTKVDPKMGGIPIGLPRRRRLRRVVGFGEAGMVQSPLIGGAFNEVLEHADLLVDQLNAALRDDQIDRFRFKFARKKTVNDLLQLSLVKPLIGGGPAQYDRMLRLFDALGPERVYRLFCSQMSTADLASFAVSRAAKAGGF